MEEIIKALTPWPQLQGVLIGMLVAAGGFWAMRRGMQESRRRESADQETDLVRVQLTDDERKAQWKFYEQMDHIHENSFAMVKHMEKVVEVQLSILAALNRFTDSRWNKGQ